MDGNTNGIEANANPKQSTGRSTDLSLGISGLIHMMFALTLVAVAIGVQIATNAFSIVLTALAGFIAMAVEFAWIGYRLAARFGKS